MSEPPPPWGETPDPWATPPAQPGWGTPPAQPGWGTPPQQPPAGSNPNPRGPNPYGPNPYAQPQWGSYTPPPGWTPPPVKRMRARAIFAGIVGCFLLNGVMIFALRGLLGQSQSLVVLALNVGVIVLAAVKGYKGFAVGFALGYVVAFMLLLGACFLLLAGLGGGFG